jgi:thioredoxin 1
MKNLQPNQFDELLFAGERALVMFYADWCPFCQGFKPLFESAAKTYSDYKLYGAKINDDDNPLWDRFSISSVPCLIAFDKGGIISRRDAKMGIGLKKSDLDSILTESIRI